MSDEDLKSGYTFEPSIGATYHFEHVPVEEAEKLTDLRGESYVVETINGTLAEGGTHQHLNKYCAPTFKDALSIATRIEMFTDEVAEWVVRIRPAAEEEEAGLSAASARLAESMPGAIEDDADKLVAGDGAPAHKQVHIQCGEMEAEVDEKIAPLILEIWKADVDTTLSCQSSNGRIWVAFLTAMDAERCLNIVGSVY